MAAEVGVPGVAMDQVGAGDPGRHGQVDRDRLQGRGVGRLRGQGVPWLVAARHQRRLTGLAEAVDADFDELAQLPRQVLDVNTRAAVDLGRKFLG